MDRHEYEELFHRKFQMAHHHIQLLEANICKTKGVLSFRSLSNSTKELLKLEVELFSVAQEIGSDVMNRYSNHGLPDGALQEYRKQRGELESSLQSVRMKIEIRKPARWEEEREWLLGFMRSIMKLLPMLEEAPITSEDDPRLLR